MIYKNGELLEMDAKRKDQLMKTFDFPVVVKYTDKVKLWDKANNRFVSPPSIAVPASSNVYIDGSVDNYQYAETTKRIDGNLVFFPSTFEIRQNHTIQESEIDLLYYLYYYSPYMENGYLAEQKSSIANGRLKINPKFQFENLKAEAEAYVNSEMLVSTVKALISNPALGIEEHELRNIAKSLFVPGVDKLDISQVRKSLLYHVKTTPNGYQDFMDAKENTGNTVVNSKVITAIEKGIVSFDERRREWWYCDSEGNKTERICPVGQIVEKKSALCKYISGDSDALLKLEINLEEHDTKSLSTDFD